MQAWRAVISWFSRLFGRGSRADKNTVRSKQKQTRVQKGRPQSVPSKYRAVSIYNTFSPCPAARRIAEQKFLAAHAPALPLGGCDNPKTCKCRYRYHQDRRQDMRRDSDHGLPSRVYMEHERRVRRDRRHLRAVS